MTVEQHAEAAADEIDGAAAWDEIAPAEIIAKHRQSAIDEATAPLRARIDLLTAEIARMEAEVKYANGERMRVQDAIHKIDRDIIQTLGKALRYPWFKDDQKNFPGATEADGVAVGDHVAETLAVEAAKRIAKLEGLGPLIEEYTSERMRQAEAEAIDEWGDRKMFENRADRAKAKITAILKGGAS